MKLRENRAGTVPSGPQESPYFREQFETSRSKKGKVSREIRLCKLQTNPTTARLESSFGKKMTSMWGNFLEGAAAPEICVWLF